MADHHSSNQQPLQDNIALSVAVFFIVLVSIVFVLGTMSLRQNAQQASQDSLANAAADAEAQAAAEAAQAMAIRTLDVEFVPASAYAISCSGCHGAAGEGVEGIAGPLFDSELMAEGNRDALFAFLVESRPIDTALTGFYHPVRGEYPIYTDEELQQLVDYLYTLE